MKILSSRSSSSRFYSLGLPVLAASTMLAGCATAVMNKSAQRKTESKTALRTVEHVDLKHYMGDWRVISEIPYFAEKDCVDSVESYALRTDGTIDNWFTFRKKSFDAPQKKITARAFVVNSDTNAEWKVKFMGGLISAKYLVIDLDPEYRWTVVGHPSRNYGWVMAREKTLPSHTYAAILKRLTAQGYDTSRFEMVPQFPSQVPHY